MNNLQWKEQPQIEILRSRKESSHLAETQLGQNEGARWDASLCPTPGAEDSPFDPATGLARFNTSCLSSSRVGGTPSFFLPLFHLAKEELVPPQAPIARPQGGM